MIVSVSEFFRLQDHLSLLSDGLQYDRKECKRLAFMGDTLLSFALAERYCAKMKDSDAGTLTKKKARLECNQTLATFMREFTDLEHRLGESSHRLNNHTIGTIFEALLACCYTIHGMDEVRTVVKEYCRIVWANHDDFTFPTDSVSIVIDKFKDDSLSVILSSGSAVRRDIIVQETNSFESIEEDIDNTFAKVKRPKQKKSFVRPTLSVTEECQQVTTIAFSHTEDLVEIPWKSRRKMIHHDPYYACCGVRKGRACLRPLWPDSSAKHRGEMYIPGGGPRVGGGGSPQWSANNIPRGATPQWSCCGRLATSPGCDSDLYDDSQRYGKALQNWTRKYESMLVQEQNLQIDMSGAAAISSCFE